MLGTGVAVLLGGCVVQAPEAQVTGPAAEPAHSIVDRTGKTWLVRTSETYLSASNRDCLRVVLTRSEGSTSTTRAACGTPGAWKISPSLNRDSAGGDLDDVVIPYEGATSAS
ncbi:hypothetical protein [Zavarzinia sp.]|uniref:hypothetical protein n=1 Tax=Zavarzinia sp. TaxID=2027920 RepID=UPI003565B6C4